MLGIKELVKESFEEKIIVTTDCAINELLKNDKKLANNSYKTL